MASTGGDEPCTVLKSLHFLVLFSYHSYPLTHTHTHLRVFLNRSGTIDKHEARKILQSLGMETTLEKSEELLNLVDADGSGEIDFSEYCFFIQMIKDGDERFAAYSNLLSMVTNTPLGALEHQAQQRNFKLNFVVLAIRPASATQPQTFVVELHMSGDWFERGDDGVITKEHCTKKFQGLGTTSKEAKYAAAKSAAAKLNAMMPGTVYEEGTFPENWMQWIDDNLLRGVDPMKIVDILAKKGFHAYRNNPLMQRICVWQSFDGFLSKTSDFDLHANSLDARFRIWVEMLVAKGIEGSIVCKVLMDRGFDLCAEQPHYYQKLRNNEMGTLTGKNGTNIRHFDFLSICERGFIEDVTLYCAAFQPVNIEEYYPPTGQYEMPLSLAAAGGQTKVIEILVTYGVKVNDLDNRGRSALHRAAMSGHITAAMLLIEKGAKIFEGDFQGNTALHLAAHFNHLPMLQYLSFQGQEFARSVTSDKIRVKVGVTFEELAKKVFDAVIDTKLSDKDVRRFEKIWLHDACSALRALVDTNVQHLLPHTGEAIMHDVLKRFDPRPETGVFVSAGVGERQDFIPTIPSYVELAMLMRYMFKQASIDSSNSWKRTALHVACDANQVTSHEVVLKEMVDIFGCNTQLRDIHGRQPIELLMIDREFPGKPSATFVREEFIFKERDVKLGSISEGFELAEQQRSDKRRAEILQDCTRRATDMIPELWHVVREACVRKRKFGMWELYEDPESLNQFYTLQNLMIMEGEQYDGYIWSVPKEIKPRVDRTWAQMYQFFSRSTRLRKFGSWQQYRCILTGLDVYYDDVADRCRFTLPKEATWEYALKDAVLLERVGFATEYDVMRDKQGNIFYRHNVTRVCNWDRPVDAVTATAGDKFCSAFQFKRKEMMKKMFTCEQCNRAWKTSAEGAKVTLKLCEPCILRCHEGHKGIRQIKDASTICLCENSGRVAGKPCCATVISKRQAILQSEALDNRIETLRAKEHNALMPPVFAMVPPKWPDGRRKKLHGWLLCRRPPLKGAETLGEAEDDGNDNESSTTSRTEQTGGSFSTRSGSLNRYEPVADSVQDKLLSADNYPYKPPVGLPEGWIEVCDVEEPMTLIPRGTRVLVNMRDKGPGVPRAYGNIVTQISKRRDVYMVRADLDGGTTMKVARSRIEVIGRPTFFCNVETGQSAWLAEDAAIGEVFESVPMQLPATEWQSLLSLSVMRRAFNASEEMQHVSTKLIYYHNAAVSTREMAAAVIQKFARNRLRLAFPPQTMPFRWSSDAFTMELSPEIHEMQLMRGGWSYLRRRAKMLGDFVDNEGDEWEEYVDSTSSEYFYWCEDDNRYQWHKPTVPQRSKAVVEYLRPNDEVFFRFPGKKYDELVYILQLRFDDETGADMYDVVHKYDTSMKIKWVSRIRLKKVPQGGDAMAMAREERKWRQQLQRQREADDRRKKRVAQKKLEDELERLEAIRTGSFFGTGEVSDQAKMMQGRVIRSQREIKCVQDEIDKSEGVARRDKMRAIVDEAKRGAKTPLSRADILSLERVTEVKLLMAERIRKRNDLAEELDRRRKAVGQRIVTTEALLQEGEAKMTSPRSVLRRRLMRRLHIAMQRQTDCFLVCEWGCGDWVKFGFDMIDHQLKRCSKRIIGCPQLCTLKLSEEDWLKPQFALTRDEIEAIALKAQRDEDDGRSVQSSDASEGSISKDKISRQQYHETEECPKRLVNCPRQCLEWVVAEVLDYHLSELCTKRPATPIFCRLGCGEQFGGLIEKLIESEDERMMHETEQCELRMVRCNWQFPDGNMCAAQMMAKDRGEHREYHLRLVGVTTYLVAGTHLYKVPKRCYRLKIQLWGGGGGGGYFLERQGGNGGGGAFVETIINVEPFDVLEVVVGTGGLPGQSGSEIETADLELQRAEMKTRRTAEMFLSREERLDPKRKSAPMAEFATKKAGCGVTPGGIPGGGEGYGGGGCWACGGGGGYSILSKRTVRGNQALVVAAGGGGGGSLHGLPGGTMAGFMPGATIDSICGGMASCERGGEPGDSGSVVNAQWPSTGGAMWQGGNGSEFGAGGGGGYYGGGGGGTRPGLAGGGGGGASYVYTPIAFDYTIVQGHGRLPGGLECGPPAAVGVGDWDRTGGLVGEGALGDKHTTRPGNSGCCRIFKPGYF